MKNKLLILIIIILLPIAILITPKGEVEKVVDNKEIVVVNLKSNEDIIQMSLDDYLVGVVGIEMPASFNIEALKAQAIAARTFAYNYLNNNEINISTSVQGYISNEKMKDKWKEKYDFYFNKIKEAVTSTNNMVIKYNDEIIKSYYFSMSNGKTEDSLVVFNEELPYIKEVDSSFEEELTNFSSSTSFSNENFCNLLSINPCVINIDKIERDDSNRVKNIIINSTEYNGIDFRRILSLRSTDFEIELLDNEIVITTKGYGHGVGMSQYGANYLANNGYNYEQILKYYYKDIDIKNF